MPIATTDPRTGEVLKTFDELTDEQLEERLARAAKAADSYRLTTHEERAGWQLVAHVRVFRDFDWLDNRVLDAAGHRHGDPERPAA